MDRVVITKPMVGPCHMQVCAADDVTDAEILEVCNRDNPSGTAAGWCEVIREGVERQRPVRCADDPDRLHFLVVC
jgi:dihydrodipicolinate reductase